MDFLSSQTFWTAVGAIASASATIWLVIRYFRDQKSVKRTEELKEKNIEIANNNLTLQQENLKIARQTSALEAKKLLVAKNETLIQINKARIVELIPVYEKKRKCLMDNIFNPNLHKHKMYYYYGEIEGGKPWFSTYMPLISEFNLKAYDKDLVQLKESLRLATENNLKAPLTYSSGQPAPEDKLLADVLEFFKFNDF